jgi:hypothetical protein
VSDATAKILSMRLKEIGRTKHPRFTDEDYRLISLAGGYLLGLANKLTERDTPPHCENCGCFVGSTGDEV